MSGHARFMLSKKCLALALTIDDSLSHTVTHFLTPKADINPPFNPFALTHTHKQRDTSQTHIMKATDTLRLGNQCHITLHSGYFRG